MMIILQIFLHIPDSVAAKGAGYTIGYYFGWFIPFLILAAIATLIIVKKRKS